VSQPPVNPTLKVLVVAASLRAGSLNHKLANRAARACRDYGANVDLATLGDFAVPLYDGDLETEEGIPPGAEELKRRLAASDACPDKVLGRSPLSLPGYPAKRTASRCSC
jgi:hypothetical protein